MEKEFVPNIETLVLRGLGFDEPCFKYKDGTNFRPLYQQAFRWFRDKYNLLFYIKKGCNPSNYYLVINEESHKYNPQMWFDTYEEAELACLRKLIEIVKNER